VTPGASGGPGSSELSGSAGGRGSPEPAGTRVPAPTPSSAAASAQRGRLAAAIVPAGSLLLLAMMVGLVLSVAGKTLGSDYGCYAGAARALLHGQPIYNNGFPFDLPACPDTYLYPPAFAVALIPWISLGGAAAGLWCIAMALCFLAGVALIPVPRDVRWLMVILGALNWPLLYAVKLGQVEPILFLGFAATWRWLDRAPVVGATTAIGTLIKVQPGLLAVWAIATRRYRAAAIGILATAALAAAATAVTGPGAWATYVQVLTGTSGTLTASHNFSPGAVAFQAGLPQNVATVIQYGSAVVAAAALLAAWRFASPVASLQATVIVSQLLASPIRDHYAVLLLLPTAWLIARGRTWAVVFPLVGWIALLSDGDAGGWLAAASIPLTFFACLAAVLIEALVERRARPLPAAAASAPK
jgi:alpha-1,2-mannosyltransferase